MNHPAEFLAAHGLALATGATVLLALGIVALLIARSPIHRQRIGEATVLGTLLWLVLACVPLPRLSPGDWWSSLAGDGDRPVAPNANGTPRSVDDLLAELDELAGADLPALPAEELAALDAEENRPAITDHNDAESLQGSTEPSTAQPVLEEIVAATVDDLVSPAGGDSEPSMVAGSRFDARSSLPYVYLAGAGLCFAWLAFGQCLLLRSLRRCRGADDRTQRVYDSLPFPPGRRRPRLLVSGKLSRPLSCGILRPTIVLPDVGRGTESATWLRHVLLHELSHHRQRDAWSHWLFNLALPVLYFHPLYWWLRGSVEMSRELVADDAAARYSTPVQYADEMIDLVRRRGFGGPNLNVVGIYSSPSQFYRRMSMLIQRKQPLRTRCSAWWRAAVVLICTAIVTAAVGLSGVRYTAAQEDEPTEPNAAAVLDELAQVADSVAVSEQVQQESDGETGNDQGQSLKAKMDAVQEELARTQKKRMALIEQYESLTETAPLAGSDNVQHKIRLIHDTINSLGREKLDISRSLRSTDTQIAVTLAEIKKASNPQTFEYAVRKELMKDPRFLDLQKRQLEVKRNIAGLKEASDNPDKGVLARYQSTLESLETEAQELEIELRPLIVESLHGNAIPDLKIDLELYESQKEGIERELHDVQRAVAEQHETLKNLGDVSREMKSVIRDLGELTTIAAGYRRRLAELSSPMKLKGKTAQGHSLADELAKLKDENALLKAKLLEVAKNAEPAAKGKQPVAGPLARAARGSVSAAQLTGTGSSLDLIGLANNYAEAVADEEIAQVEIQQAVEDEEKGSSHRAVRVAEIRYIAARKKARLLKGIVESLLNAAETGYESRMEHVQLLRKTGNKVPGAISATETRSAEQAAAQAKMNIHILKLILENN